LGGLLRLCRIVRSALQTIDQQVVHLTLIGVKQDRPTLAAGIINAVVARPKDWRRGHDMTGPRCVTSFNATFGISVTRALLVQAGALPNSQSPTPGPYKSAVGDLMNLSHRAIRRLPGDRLSQLRLMTFTYARWLASVCR
jgi:hypothetical protein